MRRLYVEIYVAFVGIALASVLGSIVVAVAVFGRPMQGPAAVAASTALSVAALPDRDDPAFDARLHALVASDQDLTLWDDHGAVVASIGTDQPFGPPGAYFTRRGTGLRLALPSGGLVAVALPNARERRAQGVLMFGGVALAMAIGAYPVARRITRRLEQLRDGVAHWGTGDLGARVRVTGTDEIAVVAKTFNHAADQVQKLFDAQRRVLASASHELRSPLARLRMAIELLDDGSAERAPIAREAVRDVEELDATVGELLQIGRLSATSAPPTGEAALRAIADEEGARVGATVTGPERIVRGDPRLIRRLIRNLLENAVRHGAPPIRLTVTATGLEVEDGGAGVPDALRERVFEPFFRPAGHAEGRDGGVGLGLHLVREIAAHHGGSVRVEGSRFVVKL
ncbi:MAG: ATP-binding protein [Myxococcota bacterium]